MKKIFFTFCSIVLISQTVSFSIANLSLYQYKCDNIKVDKNLDGSVEVEISCESQKISQKLSFLSKYRITANKEEKKEKGDLLISNILSYYKAEKEKIENEKICVECLVENIIDLTDFTTSKNNNDFIFIKKKEGVMTNEDYSELLSFSKRIHQIEPPKKLHNWNGIYFSSQESYLKVLSKMVFICVVLLLYDN